MKPTKRHCDPLGRSKTRHRYSRYLLSLAIAITGSVWPIQARSIEAIFDIGRAEHAFGASPSRMLSAHAWRSAFGEASRIQRLGLTWARLASILSA